MRSIEELHEEAEELADRAKVTKDPDKAARLRSRANALVRRAAIVRAQMEEDPFYS